MNIFDHEIKTSEIIGIGPLYASQSKDAAARSLYGAFRYEFHVHCKNHSIEVFSDYFYPQDGDRQKKRAEEWKNQYHIHRDQIKSLVNSYPSIDAFQKHLSDTNQCYRAIIDGLAGLFKDLAPAEHNEKPINERISVIYDEIRLLRDLACTK